jgi:hypothetical protein
MKTPVRNSKFIIVAFLSLVFGVSSAFGQTTIVSEGFNNSNALFTIAGTAGAGAYYSGTSPNNFNPANSAYTVAGTHAYGVTNGTVTLTSSNINTADYCNIALTFRVAAFGAQNSEGMESADEISVQISTDGGTTYQSPVYKITGNGPNAYWAYNATGTASFTYGTGGTIAPGATGGQRTTDGYSTFILTSLPSITNMRIRITIKDNDKEIWLIDDLKVTGNPKPTVAVGSALSAICRSGTTAALGGSFGGGATGAMWSDGGAGGTFVNNTGTTPGTATYTASLTSPATVTLTLTSTGGSCGAVSATKSLTVNSLPTPTITFNETSGTTANDGVICTGDAVTLIAGGGVSYDWDNGAKNANNPVSPTATTPYLVTVTDANGCSASLTKSVTVNTLPVPAINVAETSGKTANDGTICEAASVTLTGSGGTSYTWNDGSTANPLNVSPANTTTYSVTVKDANGCTAPAATKTITVKTLPVVSFNPTPDASACPGTDVTYTTQSGQTGYQWSVPGTAGTDYSITAGGIGNTSNTVTLRWLTQGNKTVTVNYTNSDGCSAATPATITTTVNGSPTLSSVSASTTPFCSGTGAAITLNGLLPNKTQTISYTIPGEGTLTTTVTSDASGVATFTTIGLSAANSGAQLTITGITRTDVDPACAYVPPAGIAQANLPTVNGELVAPVIAKSPNSPAVCVGQALTITVTTPGSGGSGTTQDEYRYSTNNGAPGSWSSWSTALPNFVAAAGVNIVETRRTATGSTCPESGTNSVSWTVVEQPEVTGPSPATQTVCLGATASQLSVVATGGTGTFSYQWYSNTTASTSSGSPVQISGATSATYTPPATSIGTTYYYCIVSQAGGNCGPITSAISSVQVVAQPTSGTLVKTPDAVAVCQGTTVSAKAAAGLGGAGSPVDILEYRFDGSATWLPYVSETELSTTGHTSVDIRTYRTATGCTQSTPVVVSWTLSPAPVPTITFQETSGTTNNDGTICNGATVTLTASGGGTYLWDDNSTSTSITVSPDVTTPYLVTVTGANGCSASLTKSVTVNTLPVPAITVQETSGTTANDGTICKGASVTLTGSGGTSYTWSTGSTANPLTVSPASTTTYSVNVTNANGCASATSYAISVNPVPTVDFLATPGNTSCSGTDVTYTTQSGQTGYQWLMPGTAGVDYSITAGGIGNTSNTVTLRWLTQGNKTVTVNYTNSDGCSAATPASFSTSVTGTPKITTNGIVSAVCQSASAQVTTLTYSGAANSATSYSIDWDNSANTAGLTDQDNTNASFATGGGTINNIAVPANVSPGTYSGTMILITANGCTTTQAVTLTVNPTNTVSAASSSPTLCINTALSSITHTTTGATGTGSATGLPAGVTAVWASNTITISGTPTVSGTFNYSIPLTGGCGPVNATGTIMVTAASVGGTISPAVTTVCAGGSGGSLTLSGHTGTILKWQSSTDGGTTWTDITNNTTTQAYTSAQTTLYRAVIKSGSCAEVFSSNAVVSITPTTTPTATSSPAAICVGQTASLSATAAGFFLAGDIDGTFNQANPAGWRITEDGKEINFPANADNASTFPWSETNGPKTPFAGGATYDNKQTDGKFAIASGPGNTTMETPIFSTIGMTSAMLQFYQALVFANGASGKIEISTNGGITYNKTLIQYNSPLNIGVPANSWNLLKLDLSDYIGLSNLRIRFTYTGANNSNWAIDGFGFPGQAAPVTYQWTPTATLTPSTGIGRNVTAAPTVTTIYTVTTTINGCPGGSRNVTVTVNPTPTVNTVNNQVVCHNSPTTAISFTGTNATSYTWTNTNTSIGLAASGTGNIASFTAINTRTAPVTATITATPVNTANGISCNGTPITITITVNPLPTAIIAGTTTVCQNSPAPAVTFTGAVGTAPYTFTYSVNNGAPQTVSTTTGNSVTVAQSTATAGTYTYTLISVRDASSTQCIQMQTGTATITVNPLPTISGTLSVCAGSTTQLTGSASPAVANPWVSAAPGVATVSNSGLVTGVAAGTSVITYTNSNGCQITATVTVNALPTITSTTLSVCVGSTITLTGSASPASSNPWVSATTSVATISGTGTAATVTGVAAGISVITYTNSNGCQVTATVTVAEPLEISTLSSPPQQCYGSSVTLTFAVKNRNAQTQFQWYKNTTNNNTGGTAISGANTASYTINSVSPADNGYYYLLVTGDAPCSTILRSQPVQISSYSQDYTVWTAGDNTTEWHEEKNWSCGIPNLYRDALVPVVSANLYPYIDGTSGLVGQTRNLTIDAGASVTLDGLLQMAGAVTNNGTLDGYLTGTTSTGMIEFVSNINFATYPNNASDPKTLVGTGQTETQHLKISNQVTFSKPVDVYGQLSFGGSNKTLATGDQLTLKSVSEMGTAMVTDRTGNGTTSGNTINGQATVERYIPAYPIRKWRLLTSPVTGVSIKNSWQEGKTWNSGMAAEPTNNFGTLITGGDGFTSAAAASAQGFDWWPLPVGATASIRKYQGSGNLVSNDLATWPNMGSTTGANAFDASQAYLVYIRGDRSKSTGTTTNYTVLRAKGPLKENLSYSIDLLQQSHTMFGNPYASPLDYKKVYLDNSSKIHPYFWIWQAKLAGMYGLGGYVLMFPDGANEQYEAIPSEASGTSSTANRMIHSGEGIFVMPQTNPAPTFPTTITIEQKHKTTTIPTVSVFRQAGTGPSKVYVNLYVTDQSNSATLMDGVLAQYDPSFANGAGHNIAKAINTGENVSVLKGGRDLIVASDKIPKEGDTLKLRIWNTVAARDYQIRVKGLNFEDVRVSAVLVDKFLQKETDLNLKDAATDYAFKITGQAGSRDPQRFYIVFRPGAALPKVTVEAKEKRGGVQVDWAVDDETGVQEYTLEKSADGINFQPLAQKDARAGAGPQAYDSFDGNPTAVTFYRVRVTGTANDTWYSDTAEVRLKNMGQSLVLYPNPATGKSAVQVQLVYKPAGMYSLVLYSSFGQRIMQQKIQHNGGTATYPLQLNGTLAAGNYKLEVENERGKKEVLSLQIVN